MLTYDGRPTTDNGPCLHYKLTIEPKCSGELKYLNSIYMAEMLNTVKYRKICIIQTCKDCLLVRHSGDKTSSVYKNYVDTKL